MWASGANEDRGFELRVTGILDCLELLLDTFLNRFTYQRYYYVKLRQLGEVLNVSLDG